MPLLTHGTLIKISQILTPGYSNRLPNMRFADDPNAASAKMQRAQVDSHGVCEGINSMLQQAVLTGPKEKKEFYDRLKFLSDYFRDSAHTPKSLKDEIDAIYEFRKSAGELKELNEITVITEDLYKENLRIINVSGKNAKEKSTLRQKALESRNATLENLRIQKNKARERNDNALSKTSKDNRDRLLDVAEFFESLLPAHRPDLFEDFNATGQLYKGLAHSVVASKALEDTGKYVHSNMLGIVKGYEKDISDYFSGIEDFIKESAPNTETASFMLTSHNHTISVHYDRVERKWHFFDVNNLQPNFKDNNPYSVVSSKDLGKLILKGFNDTDTKHTVFSIRHLSTQGYDLTLYQELEKDANGVEQPKAGKLYLSEQGDYLYKDSPPDPNHPEIEGKLHKGKVDKQTWIALSGNTGIQNKLNDINFKIDLMKVIKKSQPTSSLKIDSLDQYVKQASNDTLFTKKEKKSLGVVIKKVNHANYSPLMLAASDRLLSVVKSILSHDRSTIDQKSVEYTTDSRKKRGGETALMLAALSGNTEIVNALIQAGADLTLKNFNGKTAAELAKDAGFFNLSIHINNQSNTKIIAREKANKVFSDEIKNKKLSDIQITLVDQILKKCPGFFSDCDDVTFNNLVNLLIKIPGINPNQKFDKAGNTLLMLAAMEGRANSIAPLLHAGADVNAINEKGYSALMLAAGYGQAKFIEALFKYPDNKVEVDAVVTEGKNKGKSALMLATLGDDGIDSSESVIKALIENGANVNSKEPTQGDTPLIMVIQKNRTHLIKSLISAKADITLANNRGLTPLMMTVIHNRQHFLYHLSAFFNPTFLDVVNEDGETALMLAVKAGHLEMVNALIEAGANQTLKNKDDKTALDLAKEQAPSMVHVLMPTPPLIDAIIKEEIETLQKLIDSGIHNINEKDNFGRTALMCASMNSNMRTGVELLMDSGADLTIVDNNGFSALMLAIEDGNDEIATILLKANPEVINRVAADGTALILAAKKGHIDMVKALISVGAKNDPIDKFGYTALMYAASRGHTEVVKELLKFKNNLINSTENMNNRTALILAADKGNLETVKVLIEAGADVTIEDVNGETALDKTFNPDIKILLEAAEKNASVQSVSIHTDSSSSVNILGAAPSKSVTFHLNASRDKSQKGESVEKYSEKSPEDKPGPKPGFAK
jgi:ankyrin repeat protein